MGFTDELIDLATVSFWENKPMMYAVQKASQAGFASGSAGLIVMVPTYDNFNGYNLANSSYTVPLSGWYLVTASTPWVANATGLRYTQVRKNGTASTTLIGAITPGTSPAVSYIEGPIKCVAGDVITIFGAQTSGGTLSTQFAGGGYLAAWTMEFLRFP